MRLKKQLFLTTLIISLPLTRPVQAVTAAEINNHDQPVRTSMRLPNEGRSDLQELITRVDNQVDTQSNKAPEAESTESEEPASSEDKAPAEKPNDTVKTDDNTKAKSKVKADISPQAITTGTNGTCDWEFSSDAGLLTISAGQLSERIDNNLSAAGIVNTAVKTIEFDGQVIAPVAVTYLFANLGQLSQFISLTNFNTSAVTSMKYWFQNTKGLTNPDLSSFNTSNVTDMSYMFYGSEIETLDLHTWNVDKVTTFANMFQNATELANMNLSNWGANRTATNVLMTNMFQNTSLLKTLILTGFKTTNVSNMNNTFNATGLESLNLSSWDVTKVTTFEQMFLNAKFLGDLNLSNWGVSRTASNVNMNYMFGTTSALTSLNLTNFKTTNVTTMAGMFSTTGLTSLTTISDWDVTKVTSFANMFYSSKLQSLNLSNWGANRTAGSVDMSYMFYNTGALTALTLTGFQTTNVTNMFHMFHDTGLTSLNLSGWNVDKVTTFAYMFAGAKSLNDLNVSGWGVNRTASNVAMDYMFSNTSALTNLTLTDFKTTNVTVMSYMFQYTGLTSLDLSDWNVDKVTSFAYMFYYAKLTNLNLANWGASRTATNVTMANMFRYASALTTLTLTNFRTSNVTNMYFIFANCTGLQKLDLSNWDMAAVTNTNSMFYNSSNLWQIKLGTGAKFPNSPSFTTPTLNKKFTDNGQTYQVTTASWQKVGNGTVHRPTGDLVTTTQMETTPTEAVTYVWAQSPTFVSVPTVDFGTLSASDFANEYGYVSSSGQHVSLINLANAETYSIGVQQTDDWHTDGESATISRDTLSVALNTQSGVFWEGTSTTSEKEVTFMDSDGHFGLYFDKSATIPQPLLSKTLKSELTWTLNIVPDV